MENKYVYLEINKETYKILERLAKAADTTVGEYLECLSKSTFAKNWAKELRNSHRN